MTSLLGAEQARRQYVASRPPSMETGVVVDTGAGVVTVNCAGSAEVMRCDLDRVYMPGDVVVVLRGPMGAVAGWRVASAVDVPPAAPGLASQGTVRFPASDAGTWRGGAWRTDTNLVVQGDSGGLNYGAYFYDGATAGLAGSVVSAARVLVSREVTGAAGLQTVHLYLHTSEYRPEYDVSRVLGPVDVPLVPGDRVTVDLPAAWGQQIADAGGGIAVAGAPFLALRGMDTDPEAGLLEIDWARG